MASLFKSTKNTRQTIKGSHRYIRSDAVYELSEDDIKWLRDNNITTIVDLRTREEVAQRPSCLSSIEGFNYMNIPVTCDMKVPETQDLVSTSYIDMVDSTMWEIISTIENAQTNVLYFCFVGKDRTGVVSALLLTRQGAPDKDIIDDYVLSASHLKETLEEYVRVNPDADIEVMTPRAKYMEQFLAKLRNQVTPENDKSP